MAVLNVAPSPRILLAEDDRAVRESIERALRLDGYEVITVKNVVEVLSCLETSRVDVLMLDIMMPELDGLTTCRRLRSRGDQTPIMMVTARSETPDRVSGLDAGADDYVVKPFALDELLARVRALTRRWRAGAAPVPRVVRPN